MTDLDRIARLLNLRRGDLPDANDAFEGHVSIGAILGMIAAVRQEERNACIAVCQSAMSKHWTPEESDGLGGPDRVDYYDAACARIERAIRARGAGR